MYLISLNNALNVLIFMSGVFCHNKNIIWEKIPQQNLSYAVIAVLEEQFIIQIIYNEKEESFLLNHFSFYLMKQKKIKAN